MEHEIGWAALRVTRPAGDSGAAASVPDRRAAIRGLKLLAAPARLTGSSGAH